MHYLIRAVCGMAGWVRGLFQRKRYVIGVDVAMPDAEPVVMEIDTIPASFGKPIASYTIKAKIKHCGKGKPWNPPSVDVHADEEYSDQIARGDG